MNNDGMRDFTRKLDNIINAYRRLPTEVAAIAVAFCKERFRDQAWYDTSKQPWRARKRPRPGGPDRSQTLLVDTGRLKRSVRKVYADNTKVIIGSDVPYAKIHNEGGTISAAVQVKQHGVKEHERTRNGRTVQVRAHTVRAHSRRMNLTIPQRQFIGHSAYLEGKLLAHVERIMRNALNS